MSDAKGVETQLAIAVRELLVSDNCQISEEMRERLVLALAETVAVDALARSSEIGFLRAALGDIESCAVCAGITPPSEHLLIIEHILEITQAALPKKMSVT